MFLLNVVFVSLISGFSAFVLWNCILFKKKTFSDEAASLVLGALSVFFIIAAWILFLDRIK